jgi:hypothetical protein
VYENASSSRKELLLAFDRMIYLSDTQGAQARCVCIALKPTNLPKEVEEIPCARFVVCHLTDEMELR